MSNTQTDAFSAASEEYSNWKSRLAWIPVTVDEVPWSAIETILKAKNTTGPDSVGGIGRDMYNFKYAITEQVREVFVRKAQKILGLDRDQVSDLRYNSGLPRYER